MFYSNSYDVIVVGGGHAGCEAALACAKRNIKTLLITANIDQIGAMSCNPAVGGLGKGHLVREIDALGGEMGKNIDATGIQFRKLNTTKGPAVQGTRAQADKYLYRDRMRFVLQSQDNLHIKQGMVSRVSVANNRVAGLELASGERVACRALVITTGTFLRGLCHVGLKNFSGGRAGDSASMDLSESLIADCGLELMRLKTGTVPRIDGRTINFSGLEEQFGDSPEPRFSFSPAAPLQRQISCFITYTNQHTHEIIKGDLDKSPMFRGVIKGVGPRYCPSIEDKVVRFAEKERHQIFLEPEGLTTNEFYPNGLSTSLPFETQIRFIRSIKGLENAQITRAGYAVEYDAANPIQLKATLESKLIAGLFLAGQINGTSGYEEAAAQGIMAGINAGQYVLNKEAVVLSRSDAYIGVMIDDLVSKGVGGEPYRLFTSRAEHRMLLREDNADIRLRPLGHKIGLVDENDYMRFESKLSSVNFLKQKCKSTIIKRSDEIFDELALPLGTSIPEALTLEQLIRWPALSAKHLRTKWQRLFSHLEPDDDALNYVVGELKYEGYINRQKIEIARMQHYSSIKLPTNISYNDIPSLSAEVRQKLTQHKPETLFHAQQIPGVTPAALAQIQVFIATRF